MSGSSTLPPLQIPRQAILEGNITYPGSLVLGGTIRGDVRCTSIVVTERGVVEGSICANTATIMGEAHGSIYAEQVTLKTACSVAGEIFHKNLSLENGCYFEGKSRRVANPIGLADWERQEQDTVIGLLR
ncbi:polymer-forming cytoskeletal protein [Hyphomicrobium sp. CS1GBMeth3]|uniref:bactofilin family protein n=1 Tax=Hyphomicrobium sp. CS1GBMeth3 TaxID=1892845 RepID=UPI000931B83A|nr:polymer-forming cytoskeletal protein [Hyphomicrobium sp. CS1GBMeth3]